MYRFGYRPLYIPEYPEVAGPGLGAHHGGYSILVSLHDVPALGMVHGFVNLGRAADLEVLTEMWIQQIISRRLMNADLDEMTRPAKVAA